MPGRAPVDHGIEVAAEPVDGGAELGDMGVREVPLIGRGLHEIDRQAGEELPVPAQRVTAAGGAPEASESAVMPRERGAPSGRFFRRGADFFLEVLGSAMGSSGMGGTSPMGYVNAATGHPEGGSRQRGARLYGSGSYRGRCGSAH